MHGAWRCTAEHAPRGGEAKALSALLLQRRRRMAEASSDADRLASARSAAASSASCAAAAPEAARQDAVSWKVECISEISGANSEVARSAGSRCRLERRQGTSQCTGRQQVQVWRAADLRVRVAGAVRCSTTSKGISLW